MNSRKFLSPVLTLVSMFVLGFTAQVAAVPVLYGVVTGFGSGGGQDPTSWNSAHGSRGCGQEDLQGTGGNGFFYCFGIG